MAQEMFDLGDGSAVNCNPGGRFHGWLFRKHPDGQYVSVRKLDVIENPYGPLADLQTRSSPYGQSQNDNAAGP